MDSDRLHQWITLGANLGVIVGLAIVAIEIRHNTRVNESTVQAELLQLGHQSHDWKRDSNFAEIIVKASANYDDLSPSEQVQFKTHVFQQLNVWEHAFKIHERGLMDRSFWDGWNNAFVPNMKDPSWVKVWNEVKLLFALEFQQHVDSYVVDN